MARIYKRPDRSEYYIDMTDARGVRRRLAGYPSKPLTAELARRLEQLRDCRKAGSPPTEDLRRWLETQPAATIIRWTEIGLVDGAIAASAQPLRSHLDAWLADLEAKKRTSRHVVISRRNVNFFLDRAGAAHWADLIKDKIRAVIESRVEETGVSASTSNGWLMSLRTFVRWCMDAGRAAADPTFGVKRRSQRADRRYIRRPLSPRELRRVIAAAQGSLRVKHGMDGPQRALVYLVAASTGWRWSELKRLRRMGFSLDEDPPMIAPPGWTQKSGRDDRLPLRSDVAGLLREYFARRGHAPDAPAFPVSTGVTGAKILRYDLALTGDSPQVAEAKKARGETPLAPIPYVDERGRVADFHSLRHALATMIGRAGVPIKLAQTIMRHADPAMTLGTYTHAEDMERAAALEALPSLLPSPPVNDKGEIGGDSGAPPALNDQGPGAGSGAGLSAFSRIPSANQDFGDLADEFRIVDDNPCKTAIYGDSGMPGMASDGLGSSHVPASR